MDKPVKITLAQLQEAGACSQQLMVFAHLFPEGEAEVTVDNCVKVASYFNWWWAFWNLIDDKDFLKKRLQPPAHDPLYGLHWKWIETPLSKRARLFAEAYIEQERSKA